MSDAILPIPPIPKGLEEASRLGQLIPFVGAGVSRIAGCPSWHELADASLKWLIEQNRFSFAQFNQVQHLSPRVKLSIARLLESSESSINFEQLLHPPGRSTNIEGQRIYSSIFKIKTTFLTTNYDYWLDSHPSSFAATDTVDSPQQERAELRMNVVHEVKQFTPDLLSKQDTVIHLHGSLRAPKGMILTTREYLKHYANDRNFHQPKEENRVLTLLQNLFSTKTVLFIGYGLEDLEILEYVVSKSDLIPGEERHFMLQGYFSHERELMMNLSDYYMKQCGIRLLPFLRDTKDYRQLTNVLEEYARTLTATPPLLTEKIEEMEHWISG